MVRVEDMLPKMRQRFDSSDEHTTEWRSDLSNIGEKVYIHGILIKYLELQMAKLSTIVNPRQQGTLPSNTIQNPENDEPCMAVTNRGGKKTIDPSRPSVVEYEMRKDEDLVETSAELVDKTMKKERSLIKWSPFLDLHHYSLRD